MIGHVLACTYVLRSYVRTTETILPIVIDEVSRIFSLSLS